MRQDENLRAQLHHDIDHPDSNCSFQCTAWEALVSIREPIFKELVLEFFTTFHFDSSLESSVEPEAITFRLGGEKRYFSRLGFCVALGLFSEEQSTGPDGDALIAFLDNCARDAPATFDYRAAWHRIGRGNYVSGHTKAADLNNEMTRLIHRLITVTLTARKDGNEKLNNKDLWILSHLINADFQLDITWMVATALRDACGAKSKSPIVLGHWVTRIARDLNILRPTVLSNLEPCPEMGWIDKAYMRKMRIVHYSQTRETVWGDPNQPAEQEENVQMSGTPTVEPMHRHQPIPPRRSFQQPSSSSQSSRQSVPRMSFSGGPQQRDGIPWNVRDHQALTDYRYQQIQHFQDWQYQSHQELMSMYETPIPSIPYHPLPDPPTNQSLPPGYNSWRDWFDDQQ